MRARAVDLQPGRDCAVAPVGVRSIIAALSGLRRGRGTPWRARTHAGPACAGRSQTVATIAARTGDRSPKAEHTRCAAFSVPATHTPPIRLSTISDEMMRGRSLPRSRQRRYQRVAEPRLVPALSAQADSRPALPL